MKLATHLKEEKDRAQEPWANNGDWYFYSWLPFGVGLFLF
jgi:hypothetical protein